MIDYRFYIWSHKKGFDSLLSFQSTKIWSLGNLLQLKLQLFIKNEIRFNLSLSSNNNLINYKKWW